MPGLYWPNGSPASVVPPAPGRASSGFRATSEYGWRTHPVTGQPDTFHSGIDLVGWSTNVAPCDGVVTRAAWFGGYGNCVDVRGDNGDLFRIGHNARFLVGQGARVRALDPVAIMGTTGNSTGVHTHFETRPGGGDSINPRTYMSKGADMPLVPADKQIIKDAIFEFMRDTGQIDGNTGWRFIREAIWGQPVQAQSPEGLGLYWTDAKRTGTTTKRTDWPVLFSASGFLASTNAQVGDLRKNGAAITLTPEQIDKMAEEIAEGLSGVVAGATPAEVKSIVDTALGALVLRAVAGA